jgi:hypothetical protein
MKNRQTIKTKIIKRKIAIINKRIRIKIKIRAKMKIRILYKKIKKQKS